MNRICIEGFFIYICDSRFPSNDIASACTNKVVKSVNGRLEVKYANNSMIINDYFKCLP